MRTLRAIAAAVVGIVVLASPAAAHVSVSADAPTAGEDATLTIRVPNERDAAATVQVDVELPAPFERVDVAPLDGWTSSVTGGVISWRGRIGTDGVQDFEVTVGPLPDDDTLVFKVLQTYDSGEVVRWIEEGDGAEHPAALLHVSPAPTTTELAAPATVKPTVPVDDEAADVPNDDEEDGGSPWPGGVLAAVALGGLAVAFRRRRRG